MDYTLVTGASKGIGRAIAEDLVRSGRRVIGTYNTGQGDVSELIDAGVHEMVHLDLLAHSDSQDVLEQLANKYRFSGIVNNAGTIEFGKWPEPGIDSWDRVFSVNLRGPMLVVTCLDQSLLNGASIVNIASTDGMIGSYASLSYSASKAGLINLTRSLANVYGPRGIRVNAISPGWINTGMSTEESMSAAALTPLGRNGGPEEVARLATFLMSPQAAFITGANVVIDGGYTGVDSIMKAENDAL